MVDEVALRAAIGRVEDAEIHRSLEELKMVREVEVDPSGNVRVLVALTVPGHPLKDTLKADVTAAVASIAGTGATTVDFTVMSDQDRAELQELLGGGPNASREVRIDIRTRVLAIASGKGGVGKSSVTTNLAVALADMGKTVGVIDADVWGFSIPKMLGIDRNPTVIEQMIIPPEAHGVRVMSMDYFVQDDQAVIWRGPMLHKALEQFLVDVHWGELDYLLLDLPPGTGDVSISISQFLPRAQMVIVTTPQVTAQRVAKRAGLMAEKVNQEVLGVVENMSFFTGDDGVRYDIFGSGGGAALAEQLGVPLLGQVPLLAEMREGADSGTPVQIAAPESESAAAFRSIASSIESLKPRLRAHPELIIS